MSFTNRAYFFTRICGFLYDVVLYNIVRIMKILEVLKTNSRKTEVGKYLLKNNDEHKDTVTKDRRT